MYNRMFPDHRNRTYKAALHNRCCNKPVDMDFYNFLPNLPLHSTYYNFWVHLLIHDCLPLLVLDFVSACCFYPLLHSFHPYFSLFLLTIFSWMHENTLCPLYSIPNVKSKEMKCIDFRCSKKESKHTWNPSMCFPCFFNGQPHIAQVIVVINTMPKVKIICYSNSTLLPFAIVLLAFILWRIGGQLLPYVAIIFIT